MFRLDDEFLKDIGLNGLPDDQKQAFLEHIYNELELRVGTQLSDGLSEAQLTEFEKLIDNDEEAINDWLAQYQPGFMQNPDFLRLQELAKLEATDVRLKSEFAATKWLEVNRSDYREVVARVLEELKKEITGNKDAILGSTSAA